MSFSPKAYNLACQEYFERVIDQYEMETKTDTLEHFERQSGGRQMTRWEELKYWLNIYITGGKKWWPDERGELRASDIKEFDARIEKILSCEMCDNRAVSDGDGPKSPGPSLDAFEVGWRFQKDMVLCPYCTDNKR